MMWLRELIRIVLGVFIMFLFSFSLLVYYSLSSLEEGEERSVKDRDEWGHEIRPGTKKEYQAYLEEYIL